MCLFPFVVDRAITFRHVKDAVQILLGFTDILA